MATPPKPSSRKSGSQSSSAPKKAAAPVVTKPVTKPAPAAKSVAAAKDPAASKAVVAAKPQPKPQPQPKPAPVAKPAKIEWPVTAAPAVSAAPIAPKPISTPQPLETTPPQLAIATDIPPAATASQTKGKLIMTDVLETAKTYAEEAKARIQTAFADINDKTKVALEKSSKAFEEMGDITKGNLEAMVESSKIAAKGVETLSQGAADFGRKSFEKSSATMKSFASVKTPSEFFQLQSELLATTLDSFASEAAKNSEALLKLVNEVSQPLSNRVSVVTDKMKSIAA